MTAIPSTRARSLVLLAALAAAGLAACDAASAPTRPAAPAAPATATITTPEPVSSLEASASSEPSASEPGASEPAVASTAPDITPVPTAIDPCTLLSQAEASQLVGFSLAAGTSSTLENNDRLCSYGAEGTVLQVLVVVAPDAATAKASEPDFKSTLEQGVAQAGIAKPKLTELPGFEPGVDAAMVQGSASVAGRKIAGIALYALKGAVLVAISDIGIGTPVASAADLQAQAHTTLSRLP